MAKVEHDGQAALHVGRADPPQGVPLEPGRVVPDGGDRVEVAGQDQALAVPERGAGDDVVPHAFEVEPGTGAQRVLHEVGQGGLAPAR